MIKRKFVYGPETILNLASGAKRSIDDLYKSGMTEVEIFVIKDKSLQTRKCKIKKINSKRSVYKSRRLTFPIDSYTMTGRWKEVKAKEYIGKFTNGFIKKYFVELDIVRSMSNYMYELEFDDHDLFPILHDLMVVYQYQEVPDSKPTSEKKRKSRRSTKSKTNKTSSGGMSGKKETQNEKEE